MNQPPAEADLPPLSPDEQAFCDALAQIVEGSALPGIAKASALISVLSGLAEGGHVDAGDTLHVMLKTWNDDFGSTPEGREDLASHRIAVALDQILQQPVPWDAKLHALLRTSCAIAVSTKRSAMDLCEELLGLWGRYYGTRDLEGIAARFQGQGRDRARQLYQMVKAWNAAPVQSLALVLGAAIVLAKDMPMPREALHRLLDSNWETAEAPAPVS